MENKEIENIERLMKDKNVQFRGFHVTAETRSGEDNRELLTIRGLPAAFNSETVLFQSNGVDYCESIDPHAFDNCDMSDVIFNYNHHGRVFARTRNDSLRLKVTENGLEMEADMWADDTGHVELYRDIQRGNIDRMSFAFTINGERYEQSKGKFLRTITSIDKLYDVSAVDIPAYDATSISARAAFEAESLRREAESRRLEKLSRARKITAERAKRRLIVWTTEK